MSRLPGPVLVYGLMFLAWIGAGLFMMLAPARFGNLVNESFGVFPQVGSGDWSKKLILRVAGAGLVAFAARFALRVADLLSK
jgi:hypothetical protein